MLFLRERKISMTKPAHQDFAEKLIQLLMWEAENNGFTSTDLAEKVGGSARTYENYKYGAMPTVAGFLGILRTTRPRQVAKKIAGQCDGYFVHLSNDGKACQSTLTRQTSEIMKETSDVIKAVAETLRDGKVTEAEKKHIIREVNEAIEALLRTRICLQESK